MKKVAYRSDIDGLRAIAVLSVVLFHLTIERFAGGFVGVDVFFVISGFLITSIITTKHQQGKFTFTGFYLGRVRRIIPPLVATVLLTFIASAIILTPDDFIRFARSTIGALTSTSNVIFFLEAGYWDTSSELKPLLHTWSLGVEEQFYLVWPALIIWALSTFGIKQFTRVLIAITALSLIGALIYAHLDISGAFYLFPARIYQFAAGAAIARLAYSDELQNIDLPGWVKDTLFLLGFTMVLACVLVYDEHTLFPGMASVPPTAGTVLILLAGSFAGGQGALGKAVLCNPVSIWFGIVSYALYLVHWPIVSLYRYETGLEVSALEQVTLASAMIAAAAAMHYGLERRFYQRGKEAAKKNWLKPGSFAIRTGIASGLIALVAAHAMLNNGWSWRNPNLVLSPDAIEAGMARRFAELPNSCRIQNFLTDTVRCNRSGTTKILILGNSHEPDGFNFLRAGYSDNENLEFINFGTLNRCPDTQFISDIGWTTTAEECQARLDILSEESFITNIDYLVYAANRPFSQNKVVFAEILRWFNDTNPQAPIVTIGGYINTNIPCSRILNESGSTADCAAPSFVNYFGDTPDTEPLFGEIMGLTSIFIDRVDLLCAERALDQCLTRTPSGIPMFYDEHHLSLEFAQMAGEMYAAENPTIFSNALNDTDGATLPSTIDRRPLAALRDYNLAQSHDSFTSTPTVRARRSERGWLLEQIAPINESTGGRTGVAYIELSGRQEEAFSNQNVRVHVTGHAEESTEVWVQYSTNEVGNSGWRVYPVDRGEFAIEFSYSIAPMRNGRSDFLGVAPNGSPLTIHNVRITTVSQ